MKVLRILLGLLLIYFHSAGGSYFVFKENGKSGLKNDQGKILIPAEYESIGWSNNTFSIVNNVTGYRLQNKWGLINVNNSRVTAPTFVELFPAEASLITASKLSKNSSRPQLGCISVSGKEVIPFTYDGIFVDGLRAIVFTKIGNQF